MFLMCQLTPLQVAGSAGPTAASLLSFPKQKAGLTPECSDCPGGTGQQARGRVTGQDLGNTVPFWLLPWAPKSHGLRFPILSPLCGAG